MTFPQGYSNYWQPLAQVGRSSALLLHQGGKRKGTVSRTMEEPATGMKPKSVPLMQWSVSVDEDRGRYLRAQWENGDLEGNRVQFV